MFTKEAINQLLETMQFYIDTSNYQEAAKLCRLIAESSEKHEFYEVFMHKACIFEHVAAVLQIFGG